MRVGVVGDIHGSYCELKKVLAQMGEIDHLLFTGDGVRDIDRLKEETGILVRGVKGNCDFAVGFSEVEIFYLDQYKVLLTHGHLFGVKSGLTRISLLAQEKGVDLVVFGHTHLPLIDEWNGIKLFNPGTLYRERSYLGLSYGIIETDEHGIYLSHGRI